MEIRQVFHYHARAFQVDHFPSIIHPLFISLNRSLVLPNGPWADLVHVRNTLMSRIQYDTRTAGAVGAITNVR